MPDITIDDIRRYVEEKGPVTQYGHWFNYWVNHIIENLFRFPKDDRTERSRDSLAARIAEILPVEGQITLSGKNRPVIIYDGETQSYRETALDVTKVQPVPTDKKFELNGNKPIGPLEIVSFEAPPLWDAPTKGLYPYNGAAANFLEKLLAIKAPVVEIGNQVGGYFPMRPYS